MASNNEITSIINEKIKTWPNTKKIIALEIFDSYSKKHPKWADAVDPEDPYNIIPIEIFDGIFDHLNIYENHDPDFSWKINSLISNEPPCRRDLRDLEGAADTYCEYNENISSPTLELWLLRTIVYEEISAFKEEHIKILGEKKNFKSDIIIQLSFAALMIFCSIMIGVEYSAAVGFMSFFSLGYLHKISEDIEKREKHKVEKMYKFMKRIYSKILYKTPSPSEIERLANEASQSGVIWPYRFYDLIKIAKNRSPMNWN